jgi:hypothetical protein
MARVMEIFVIVNAACGIGAFLIARGAIKKMRRKLGLEEEARNLERKEQP